MRKWLVALAMTATIAVGIAFSGQSNSASAEPFKLNGDPKIAWIYFSEMNDGGWTQAIHEARQRMEADLGMKITWVEKIPEIASQVTYAADRLIQRGHNIIIGGAFGHSDAFKTLSEKYPDLAFLNPAGTTNGPNLNGFYGRTYAVRGQDPYLTPEFFDELRQRLPDQTLFFIAIHKQRPVGIAFMMTSHDTLYGRHWGCEADYNSLHFETCYYAGIDYCIDNGLYCFDAGAQGEHKIRRGFEPVATWSNHVIAEPRLARAVDDFCRREADMMASFEADQRERCDFQADSAASATDERAS